MVKFLDLLHKISSGVAVLAATASQVPALAPYASMLALIAGILGGAAHGGSLIK